MKVLKNKIIKGSHHKPILLDAFYNENKKQKPIVVFVHGYKGFKDWGAWNLMAKTFAAKGFCFIKFNFSHNGGTVEQPIDFPDLEAFGLNNYTKELDDLEVVLNWVVSEEKLKQEVDINHISLIGHSRGGGIVLIKADEDSRIKRVITLAGVSDYKSRFPKGEEFKEWKEKGVFYVDNGRTKQKMPHYFQFYEDFINNKERLTIKRATENLKIPHLIIHGDNDTSVNVKEADNLKQWNPKAQFNTIKNADHVFNTKHPWGNNSLSKELKEVSTICVDFLNQ